MVCTMHTMTEATRSRNRCFGLAACLLALLPLIGCDGIGASTLERARSRGFIRAGYSEEPPYAFRDSAGRITGESPEALRAAAERVGISEIQWVRLDFGHLVPALRQGRVDVIAAGLYRTESRAERVRFSRPTLCSGPALVVRAGRAVPRDLVSLEEAGGRVAVLAGSMEESALRTLRPAPARTVSVPDLGTGLTAVREGSVDALAVTAPTARLAVRSAGDDSLEVVEYEPPPELTERIGGCSALAFRPGPEDRELAGAIDRALGPILQSANHRRRLRALGFTEGEIRAAADSAQGGSS